MSDDVARAWRFYVDDMIALSEKVLAYVDGLDQPGFIADERTYDATLRNLVYLEPVRDGWAGVSKPYGDHRQVRP